MLQIKSAAALCAALITPTCYMTECATPPFLQTVSVEDGKWMDMSYVLDEDTIYWPTAHKFDIESEFYGRTPLGFFYSANHISASEHGGTHIDAPIHFVEGGKSVDEVTLERLTGWAVVIDVSDKALEDPDYLITPEDILKWEKLNGLRLSSDMIVILHTGYGQYWPDPARYLGTAERGSAAVKLLHFPGLSADAASLLSQRGIKAVGIDTASIDFGQSTEFEAHSILLKHGIVIFENVANLGRLVCQDIRGVCLTRDDQSRCVRLKSEHRALEYERNEPEKTQKCSAVYYFIALPIKIRGGSGAPMRIIAWVDSSQL
eukprot:GHVN01040638.1.p1 GENE.GHVN01040638.1~~GHVN01040638.1.p1  ORF type:complete len:343 (+),score=29.79 GHVN01040638.1:77-1030(+)